MTNTHIWQMLLDTVSIPLLGSIVYLLEYCNFKEYNKILNKETT
jgi:hypothetical protein